MEGSTDMDKRPKIVFFFLCGVGRPTCICTTFSSSFSCSSPPPPRTQDPATRVRVRGRVRVRVRVNSIKCARAFVFRITVSKIEINHEEFINLRLELRLPNYPEGEMLYHAYQ